MKDPQGCIYTVLIFEFVPLTTSIDVLKCSVHDKYGTKEFSEPVNLFALLNLEMLTFTLLAECGAREYM